VEGKPDSTGSAVQVARNSGPPRSPHYRVLSGGDGAAWNRVLPPSRSVFGSYSFVTLVAQKRGFEPALLVVEGAAGHIAYPLLLRPAKDLPFARGLFSYDSLTPEYTGPIITGVASPDLQDHFRASVDLYSSEKQIVAEFCHLHPWAGLGGILDTDRMQYDRDIVYVDLSIPPEVLWRDHFSHACRKNINRGRQRNLRVFQAETEEHIREFYRIYVTTMDRNRADSCYYFDLEYFLSIFKQMASNARFVLAEYQGKVVAATLYMHDAADVFSYLGGADVAAQDARPTNAVVFDTINWARREGKQRVVLGGGYRPNDGIFRFKSSFSRTTARFFVYRKVRLHEQYAELERRWQEYYGVPPDTQYFPSYRLSAPGHGGSQPTEDE